MKKIAILLFITLPFLQSFQCGKNKHIDWLDAVQLTAILNDSSETIHIGDTLKFALSLPNPFTTKSGKLVTVNSLQECSYRYIGYWVDTVTHALNPSFDDNEHFLTDGGSTQVTGVSDPHTHAVFLNRSTYKATLNIVPKHKGIYYFYTEIQASRLAVNGNDSYGSKVNLNVTNRHLHLVETYNPGTILHDERTNAEGSGSYCFRVK
ncbi:MAG: hypothetical protein ABL929_00470 [Ferruginibacter sp.]|nr:hypothetical protein [Ferruginibacter sp.]